MNKRVETLFKNALRRGGGHGHINDGLQFRLIQNFESPPRYIHAVVADTLDVSNNFQSCCDETEIRGYWLLESEDLEADIIDFEFKLIQLIIFIDNPLC